MADPDVLAPEPPSIERRRGLSHREFLHEYVERNKPVILLDAFDAWPARRKWTLDYFRDHHGAVAVKVDGVSMTMRELVERTVASSPEAPGPYLKNQLFQQLPAELTADVTPTPECTRPNWLTSFLVPGEARDTAGYLELYIGGAGAGFPILHYDGMHAHAFIMEVVGRKEFIVYPPAQTEFLYPLTGSRSNNSALEDARHVDLERFPLFARAAPIKFMLDAGETLFVPSGWWHITNILTPCISVSINTANATNWRAYRRDFCEATRRKRSRLMAAAWSVALFGAGFILEILDYLEALL